MSIEPNNPSLPSRELARQQSEWLRSARTRLFRQVNLARRNLVLELGAGWGDVSVELADRSSGEVIALDHCEYALKTISHPNVRTIHADAHEIPLPDNSVDLVATQCSFLWFRDPVAVVQEIVRVLKTDGAVACIEPDFGGLMEHPRSLATRDIWLAALKRQAAHPLIGRSLPAMFSNAGFHVDVYLLERTTQPSDLRFDFLKELSLTERENQRVKLAATESARQRHQTVHLPFFLMALRRLE